MPLVFVPTPLGNLRDITLRAMDVLRHCDLLVAEDSRVARKLLSALALGGKEIWTYHEHNAATATAAILERARTQLVALTTDAGMPGISDPGNALAAAAREQGVPFEVLPGPSAAPAAAVLSGFPLRRFIFEGFAPRTSAARRAALIAGFAAGVPGIWYESPQRVRAFLADVEAVDPRASVFLLREYTKRFEQQLAGTAAEVARALGTEVRGEITLVILPGASEPKTAGPGELDAGIDEMLDAHAAVTEIAKHLSERGLGERRDIYARASERKRARKDSGAPGR